MDTNTIETAGVEYREHDGGRLVSGPVVNYGSVAMTRRGRERIAAGAFLGLNDAALPVNIQHQQQQAERIATVGDGLLTFTDTPAALLASLRLPDTPVGHRAAAGVRDGKLTGWSSEFVPLMETAENGINTVYRALAVGLGLVDIPAYGDSLVVMNRGGGGRFYYGRDYTSRDRGRQRKERYRPGAFERGFRSGRDVVLYLRETRRGGVASTAAGSLVLTDTDDYLEFSVEDFGNAEAARDFVALAEAEALDFGVRPLVQVPDYPDAYTDIPEPGNPDVTIREYRDVILNGLLITNSKGVNPDSSDVFLRARRLAWL